MSAVPSSGELTLFLSGDVMLGRGVDQILPHPADPAIFERWMSDARDYVGLAERRSGEIPRRADFAWPWGDALAEIEQRAPDARIVNLETSVTRDGEPEPKGIQYRMSPDNLPALTAARPDVVVLANNHVLDWGPRGLLDTLAALSAAGLSTCGAGRDLEAATRPAALARGAGRVLVFGLGCDDAGVPPSWAATPSRPGVARPPDLSDASADEVVRRISAVRRSGDVVVVSVHWGSNWGYSVPGDHARFAHRLVDGGVDVVHGHSSHHPRPIEVYRGKLVLYGCGDLINDYEGIGGLEQYRPDLVLLWFARVDRATGWLLGLEMTPMRLRRLRLERVVEDAEVEWLAATLTRASSPFSTRVVARDRTLRLVT